MIVSDKDIESKLSSPNNLMNRLALERSKKNSSMSLFGIGRTSITTTISATTPTAAQIAKSSNPLPFINPFETKTEEVIISPESLESSNSPTPFPATDKPIRLDDLLDDNDSNIKLGLAHTEALDTLVSAVQQLKSNLHEISPSKLPAAIMAASKVVESIRRERSEAQKNNKGKNVTYVFYTPTQKPIEEYDIIDLPLPIAK